MKSLKFVGKTVNTENISNFFNSQFPKTEEDQSKNVFNFEIETYNKRQCANPYGVGLYEVQRLQEKWGRDLTGVKLKEEGTNVKKSNAKPGNPDIKMLKHMNQNHQGEEKTTRIKTENVTLSSYKIPCIAHNSSGCDDRTV